MTEVDPFNIRAHVPDFQAQTEGYRAASDETRARRRSRLDVQYGPAPRQRLDLFFPDDRRDSRPIHVFIHGGYWRAQQKEDYAFVAEGVLAAGAIAAIVEYNLLPRHRMADLVSETRRAVAWLAGHAGDFGADATQISASGHSAGAHLCSFLVSKGNGESGFPDLPVKSLLLLSGIYDITPIPRSYLQPELGLTDEEVAAWSPLQAVPAPDGDFTILFGDRETFPFCQQAEAYGQSLRGYGVGESCHPVAGHEHMSIVRELGFPDSAVGRLLHQTINRSRD